MRLVTFWVPVAVLLCLLAATSEARAQSGGQGSGEPGASSGQSIPPDQLDNLLAPIALYPDALVVQILQCAASPYQVNQVDAWLKQNPGLKGTAAQEAAQKQGFDASFIAIVLFPDVLHHMAGDMDWTRQLGQAFTTDRDGVMASVQRLRKEAQSAGNLETTQQQTVKTETTNGQQVIVIQPANPQVVYVPQYDPKTVYTEPAPATTTQDSSGKAVAAGLIGFAAGVIVGAAADNDDDHYYYACGGWGYARPICYPGGYNDYYEHRENMANDYYDHRQNMANDYYDHRQNMADQRGQIATDRQDAVSQNQAARQQSRSDAQSSRQDTRSQEQAQRQQSRSDAQSDRSADRATAGDNRAAAQSSRQDAWQSRGTTSSRGAYQDQRQAATRSEGTRSGAFSGYQRGSTERISSQRGQRSMSRSGFSRGGGRRR